MKASALCKETVQFPALTALAGNRVDPIEDDCARRAHCISNWNLTQQCDSLAELRDLLARMGLAMPN